MITNELYDLAHSGDVAGVRNRLNVDPDQLNSWVGDGYTPLHVACMFGHEELVRFLIARDALVNLNAMNASGATPLHVAVCFRDENVADRIARILIDSGAELNAAQQGGQTALHHAVARGSHRLVTTLIDAGADPFLEDGQGRAAADLARALSNEENAEPIRAALKRAFSLPLESR